MMRAFSKDPCTPGFKPSSETRTGNNRDDRKGLFLTVLGVILIVSLVAFAGCTGPELSRQADTSSTGSFGNPASAFCERQGCRSEIRNGTDDSQYGVCVLPNGTAVDEWEYFRSFQPHS